jgi:hypothetical protein
MAKKLSSIQKLKHIEDETFKLGNKCAKSFENDDSIHSLKATVMAYRCSMQAIRDQARYKIVKK